MTTLVKTIVRNEFVNGIIVVLIFFLLLFTSCAQNTDQVKALLRQQTAAQESAVPADSLNSGLVQRSIEARKAVATGDYKIGAEDLLEVEVFQIPELKTLARVSAKGQIRMHLIEKVDAAGHTVSELEALIAQELGKYVKEPVVSVFVKEFRSQQISVLGAVKDPRVFYVSGQKYLMDMLSMAGGLTPDAGSVCIVQTVSGKAEDSTREKLVIDLDALLVKGMIELNIPLYAGDVLQVPKRGIFFVSGAVRDPGEFQLKGKTTLTQAISVAKGLSYEASHSDIKIYRDSGKPEREVFSLDYDSILDGKENDFELRDKDIVLVSSNGFKSLLKGISGALNVGSFSLGKGL